VEDLKGAVVSKKATLDASVADAQSATAQAQAAKANVLSARDQAGAFKDAVYSAAQSAASAVAYQDLSAVALTKAVTAVDVFIYDTSKDSDGGAWRHRCAGTSWYREPLNTLTRGARREFPAVAVIVVESNKVTIYDGDDPTLPMWMVFNTGLGAVVAYGDAVTSVAALNGEIVVGTVGAGGLSRISLFEKAYQLIQAGGHYTIPARGVLVNRNSGVAWPSISSAEPRLANSLVNDVAMAVLPGAPVDPVSGLPVPTIAVALGTHGQPNGGVSIIRHDGVVVDWAAGGSAGGYHVDDVSFSSNGQLIAAQSYDGQYAYLHVFDEMPSSDIEATHMPVAARNYTSAPSWRGPTFNGRPLVWHLAAFGDAIAIGFNDKLTRIVERPDNPSSGMVSYATSRFISGWLPGATRGAFLASTDDADLVSGIEQLPRGDFSSSTGWILIDAAISGGQLSLNNASAARAEANYALPAGARSFKIIVDVDAASSGTLRIEFAVDQIGWVVTSATLGVGTHEFLIGLPATSTGSIRLIRVAGAIVVNSLSVTDADDDRSANLKPLSINGTITRAPVVTGAELVAYSGFSGADFLEQPFNSGLNFGIGDFCIMGWLRFTNLGTWQGLFARTNRQGAFAGSTDTMYARLTDQGRLGFYLSTGSATTSQTISDVVPVGTWVFWALVRRNGVLQWFINGAPSGATISDGTDVSNITDGTEVFLIGREYFNGGGFAAGNTSFALFRIGATAPTADQIRRIYEDEKFLFQENAACTLYGASDAVTALAHDPDTGLLHVGTSAGRSVFKGLRRVANTAVPVGAAIAAAGGMVVEA
jgi:hypothetical protein